MAGGIALIAVSVAAIIVAGLPGGHAARITRNFTQIAGGPYFAAGSSGGVADGNCYRVTAGPTGRVCMWAKGDATLATDCSIAFDCQIVLGDFAAVLSSGITHFNQGGDCEVTPGSNKPAEANVNFIEDDTYSAGQYVFDVSESACVYTITFSKGADEFWDPTGAPTHSPSTAPSSSPTTAAPTLSPTTAAPTHSPSTAPSSSPTSAAPTSSPTTAAPTTSPSMSPSTAPSSAPTSALLQAEYDAMPEGASPSTVGLTWREICNAVGDETEGCPATGKYEWCAGDGKYFDAPKADGSCTRSGGLMVRNGRCYTCK